MRTREEFNKQLSEIIASKKKNHVYLNKSAYDKIVMEVMRAKQKAHAKTPLDYRRLHRYDIDMVGGDTRLIFLQPHGRAANVRYFITTDELFDVIHNAHVNVGHGGRNRLMQTLQDQYKNVTAEAIMLYLSLCTACRKKSKGVRKAVTKPVVTNELNCRGQVDVIDPHLQPDAAFKFILYYQDHATKFVVLRPLRTDAVAEVADNLLAVFTLLGAPSVLHSDSGRDFVNATIAALTCVWDGVKIVGGTPRHAPAQGAIERAHVQDMLAAWMRAKNTSAWARGLHFIQMMHNRVYHDAIKQTPHEALFGVKMKLGLRTAPVPADVLAAVHSEEDLLDLVKATPASAAAMPADTHTASPSTWDFG